MKILIAEDVPSNQKVLALLMARYGECDAVDTGVEAVRRAAAALKTAEPYRLLCLDFLMPDINGREALGRIRFEEDRAGIPEEGRLRVICLSTVDDRAELGELLEDPWTVYLAKPVTSRQLREALQRLGLAPREGKEG